MKATSLFLLIYLIAFKLSAQHTFADSLNFFLRTKTKEIHVAQKSNGKVFRTTTVYFNKDKRALVWCDKHIELPYACGDTIYFDPVSDLQVDSTVRYFCDHQKRVIKMDWQVKPGEMATTEYFYTDSLSKRIKCIIKNLSVGSTMIDLFRYEMDQLKNVYESYYDEKVESHRTYTYLYYPDGRVKTETIKGEGKLGYVSEYTYVGPD